MSVRKFVVLTFLVVVLTAFRAFQATVQNGVEISATLIGICLFGLVAAMVTVIIFIYRGGMIAFYPIVITALTAGAFGFGMRLRSSNYTEEWLFLVMFMFILIISDVATIRLLFWSMKEAEKDWEGVFR